MSQRILIVEDDLKISNLIRLYLQKEGYEVAQVTDGALVLEEFKKFNPDLVILDLMLPNLDGLTILKNIRQKSDVYVLILSAKGEELDRVLGLELGADDYVTKPFSAKELVSRIKSRFRRQNGAGSRSRLINIKNLKILPENYEIYLDNQEVKLTKTEFKILLTLVESMGKVYTRDEIMDKIYQGSYSDVFDRTIDVHITNLRKKLSDQSRKIIKTVKGIGYKVAGQ